MHSIGFYIHATANRIVLLQCIVRPTSFADSLMHLNLIDRDYNKFPALYTCNYFLNSYHLNHISTLFSPKT